MIVCSFGFLIIQFITSVHSEKHRFAKQIIKTDINYTFLIPPSLEHFSLAREVLGVLGEQHD